MTAQAVLSELRQQGIEPTLTPDGKSIKVPADRLTDKQRAAILANKLDLIALLQEAERLAVVHSKRQPAGRLSGAPWVPLAETYYMHHWRCRQCCAAGQNPQLSRCEHGAGLWRAYFSRIINYQTHCKINTKRY